MRISQGSAHNKESGLKTYWHIDTVHVHVALRRLVEGVTRDLAFRAKLMLRGITLCNRLRLLQGLGSFLFSVKANGRTFVRDNMRFDVTITLIVHEKMRLGELVKLTIYIATGLTLFRVIVVNLLHLILTLFRRRIINKPPDIDRRSVCPAVGRTMGSFGGHGDVGKIRR